MNPILCPVCNASAVPFDVVDFNKSCDLENATGAPLSGIPIYYFRCGECGFLFAPEMQKWSPEEFSEKVYNAEYVQVDPAYIEIRPKQNAEFVEKHLGSIKEQLKHLDFGGGNGAFSQIMLRNGWDSTSYDPFYEKGSLPPSCKYDLVTAFEVVEHAADVNQLMAMLSELLAEDGVLLFTTGLSDGQLAERGRLTWWYASPRNGHISLFSSDSLIRLLARYGLEGIVFEAGWHLAFRVRPQWLGLFMPPKTFKARFRDLLGIFPPMLAAVRWARNVLSGGQR